MPQLTYHIRMPEPHTHYFEVELHLSGIDDATVDCRMAVWTPGSYLVREYAKNVEQVTAADTSGATLQINRLAKNKWEVVNNGNSFVLRYRVYGFEETVRTNFLNEEHASVIPAALFMYPEKYDIPSVIHFHPHAAWHSISTSLFMHENDKWVRTAPDRDTLFDSPVEIGNQEIIFFKAAGVEHELAVYGKGNYDLQKLERDFIKIIETEVEIFGQHPCKKYVFILQNTWNARGGLEHLHSTSLIAKRLAYSTEKTYHDFLSLVSHEYFHLWNVKRLRPFALGPFHYGEENYTTSLWIAEGFTNYYDYLILRRAGILSVRNYLDIAEKNINDTENTPGDAVQPVAEASFEAWIKYYRQNENSPNAQVNYYTKGGVLAMLLDLLIIAQSDAKYSLDDVMCEAYTTFYLEQDRGYTEDAFRSLLEKYAGINLAPFYNDHVFGTRRLDYGKYFSAAGIRITDLDVNKPEKDFGITINELNSITQIRKGSAGEKGKLNVNDEIIAIENYRYNGNVLPQLTAQSNPGDTFAITVNRGGILKNFTVRMQLSDKVNYRLEPIADATPAQQKVMQKWLYTIAAEK